VNHVLENVDDVESESASSSTFIRIAILIAFALMGVATGVSGAFMQAQRTIFVFGEYVVVIPWGMLLMLVVLAALTRLATTGTRTRWGAWLFFTGWLSATILLAAESPSGDLAISSGVRQLVYLFGGVIISVAIATFPVNFRSREKNREPVELILRQFRYRYEMYYGACRCL
jgi:hypothetical protein